MKLLSALTVSALIAASVLTPVTSAAARDNAPSASEEKAAVKKFGRAQKAYDEGKYERALKLFLTVAKVLDSPNALFMAARCLRELDRLPEAFERMSSAVSLATQRAVDDPSYLQTRDAAAAEREQIGAKIGRVVVAVVDPPESLEVRIDGRQVEAAQWGEQLGVAPGLVIIEAVAADHEPFRRELELGAGDTETVAVALRLIGSDEPLPGGADEGGALLTAGLVTLGIGVVGMGLFVTTGVMANSRFSQLEDECGQPPCTDPKYADVVDEGKTLDLLANVGVGIGAAGLIAGTVMIAIGWPGGGAEEGADEAGDGEVSLSASPDGAGIGYLWRF